MFEANFSIIPAHNSYRIVLQQGDEVGRGTQIFIAPQNQLCRCLPNIATAVSFETKDLAVTTRVRETLSVAIFQIAFARTLHYAVG